MTEAECRRILQQIDIFTPLADRELEVVAAAGEEFFCEPGEILLAEGEQGDALFILLQGRLAVYKGKRILAEITPVDYVGEMAIIEDEPRCATVKVCEKSRLLKIPALYFRRFLADNPQSLLSIIKILGRRVRLDNELIAREFEQMSILIHDMKNLLSLFLLLDNFPAEKGSTQEKNIRFMKMARSHIASLVEQALANSRKLVAPEGFGGNSLQAVIDEMREADFVTHPDLRDKKIMVNLAPDLPEFSFSKLHIRRVLLNLLINAAQASGYGAEIRLSAGVDQGHVVIKVADQGGGIADAVARKIFEPHYTTKADGNGLGLPSCRQIVENRYGGTISFCSKPEQGTVFTVSLPVFAADRPASPPPAARASL
jgi:signal transduction histidine kinase